MWFTLLSTILGPLFGTALKAYQAKLAAGNTSENIAAELAGRELLVQQAEIQAQSQLKIAQVGHWSEPEHLFAYVTLIFYTKVLLWDKVLGSLTGGKTDALTGAAAVWAGMIMSFWFGKRTVESVIRLARKQP